VTSRAMPSRRGLFNYRKEIRGQYVGRPHAIGISIICRLGAYEAAVSSPPARASRKFPLLLWNRPAPTINVPSKEVPTCLPP
jgi:hypothetical protein